MLSSLAFSGILPIFSLARPSSQPIAAEILKQKHVYASTVASATKIASKLVRFGLPLLDRLMASCDPNFSQRNVFPLSFSAIGNLPAFQVDSDHDHLLLFKHDPASQSCSQLIRRLSLLDDRMSSMDLLILPARIHCHDGGIKSICHSHLDPNYIATGGSDAAVRIFNSQTGKCVAQLTGHESIISWIAFSELNGRR
jgi:WD40 repeat protein